MWSMFKPKHNTVLTDVTNSSDPVTDQALKDKIIQAQQQMSQSVFTIPSGYASTASSGTYIVPAGSSISSGSITTVSGGINPYWSSVQMTPYVPTLDPESVINMNGTELKVKDLVSRLSELEDKFKHLKMTVELLKP